MHTRDTQSKPAVDPTEDQDKLLTEALNQVRKHSFEMKTCLVSLATECHSPDAHCTLTQIEAF